MRGVLADGSEIELTAVDGGYTGHLRDGLASWRETGQPCYADWPILLSVDGKALWAKPAYPSGTNPDFGVAEPVQPKTGTSRRREILERIASCVCRDRQNTYGDAEDNFKNIAAYWNLWLRQRGLLAPGKEINPLDVAQMSAFIKVARKVGNLDYLDNWIDGGGYEVCGAGIVLSREGGKP